MKIPKIAATTCWLVLLVLPDLLQAQTTSSQVALKPVRSFVQELYGWYVPKALDDSTGPASERALKYRSYVFSSELFRALKEDSDAQARISGYIVGLDFDPFLNTQDPCERYELGGITQNGETYRIEVFGVCSGTRHEKPDVIAEVARRNGRLVFTNFIYDNLAKQFPHSANLLATLKLLREERQGKKPNTRAE
jgi:hypothetical protein